LAHEIEMAKEVIVKIEDQQLELMEQGEAAQKEAMQQLQVTNEFKKLADGKLAELASREQVLRKELADLDSNRAALAAVVDDVTRSQYERLFKTKGNNVVVGINHQSCGGCHMKLSRGTV